MVMEFRDVVPPGLGSIKGIASESFVHKSLRKRGVIEPLLLGIVLGLIPVTLAGLFVAAYMQYRRGDQLNF